MRDQLPVTLVGGAAFLARQKCRHVQAAQLLHLELVQLALELDAQHLVHGEEVVCEILLEVRHERVMRERGGRTLRLGQRVNLQQQVGQEIVVTGGHEHSQAHGVPKRHVELEALRAVEADATRLHGARHARGPG